VQWTSASDLRFGTIEAGSRVRLDVVGRLLLLVDAARSVSQADIHNGGGPHKVAMKPAVQNSAVAHLCQDVVYAPRLQSISCSALHVLHACSDHVYPGETRWRTLASCGRRYC
jgi:hypothetical protein